MSDEPIASTKERLGSYDAIESAKPGEPLFPIQGGDPLGPPTVLHWVKLCREAGMATRDPKEAERLLRKATDAEHIAWNMVSYQRGEQDIKGTRARYADDGPQEVEIKTLREALIRGAGRLHNCLAEATILADLLAKNRIHPEQEVQIREAIAALKEAAFKIEPRRGMERT